MESGYACTPMNTMLMRPGKLRGCVVWLRRNAWRVIATSLILFGLLGAAQALFLPLTTSLGWRWGKWAGGIQLVSSNAPLLGIGFDIGTDPNWMHKTPGMEFVLMRQQRVLQDIEFLPKISMSRDVGWSYQRLSMGVDLPYVLILLFGIAMELLWRRIKNRRRRGLLGRSGVG